MKILCQPDTKNKSGLRGVHFPNDHTTEAALCQPNENVPTPRTGGRLLGTWGPWLPQCSMAFHCSYNSTSTTDASTRTTPSRVLHASPNAPSPSRRKTGFIVTLMFSRPKMSHIHNCVLLNMTHFSIFPLNHHHRTDKKRPYLN